MVGRPDSVPSLRPAPPASSSDPHRLRTSVPLGRNGEPRECITSLALPLLRNHQTLSAFETIIAMKDRRRPRSNDYDSQRLHQVDRKAG